MILDIVKTVILGIIEGITEFIPISSTGHLIIAGDFLTLSSSNQETFSIAIQLGAILAVIFLYPHIFKSLLLPKNWFGLNCKNILIAIIPVFICGALFYTFIKEYLFFSLTVSFGLILGALIMLIVEWRANRTKLQTDSIDNIKPKQALIIGLCQCFSLWPGVSRAGATIVGGLISGLNYQIAAQFSFIIAVPVMIAAVLYDLFHSINFLTLNDLYLIIIGFIISFIVAYFSMITFLKLLSKWKLAPFAFYRIILACIIWIIYF